MYCMSYIPCSVIHTLYIPYPIARAHIVMFSISLCLYALSHALPTPYHMDPMPPIPYITYPIYLILPTPYPCSMYHPSHILRIPYSLCGVGNIPYFAFCIVYIRYVV